ncbi:hypothetical protein RDV64_01650 [Acuticoccus sp. MNP-M23]|uniref:hypothetical protein n=1 Tax=Acuticoccus sp. MNP-M23 TaxID=3072793 RepID=UPI002815AC5F|nr:hypothetical protein [Acuticoccus sp. MNP-M23]WMS43135.1 hypothetical protein RDV64_01650 [Acuticoccus sp. MNP-M23]
MINHVPVTRSFSLVTKTENDHDGEFDIQAGLIERRLRGWNDIEQEYRAVILAPAGGGKTHEMRQRAVDMYSRGRSVFFLPIEEIEDDFDDAFEIGDRETFEAWLTSTRGQEAWFFLDSVDEARLKDPRTFQRAIRQFSKRIYGARNRAHIFISSRPYAWRARTDRMMIEDRLPFVPLLAEAMDGTESPESSDKPTTESAVRVFQLDDLDEVGIRLFANHREVENVEDLLAEIERLDLSVLAGRPFDLESLIAKWKVDGRLGTRLDLLRHAIDSALGEINPDRHQLAPLNLNRAREGARALAAAVLTSGMPGIRVPGADQETKGIDAEVVLGDWAVGDVQTLLQRGVFNDALYGIVRFRHREVRELLAAEWFSGLLENGGSRRAIEGLFLRERYGECVLTPRFKPLLPWFVLLDRDIRQRVSAMQPEVVINGGDPAQLPLDERRQLLDCVLERIAQDVDDHSARFNAAIVRIAQEDLAADVLRLIEMHKENDDAIFFLGRVVWQGRMVSCLPLLADIALDAARGIYARIVSIRAVMTCGSRQEGDRVWNGINASNAMPRQVLAELVNNAAPDAGSVDCLLTSLKKVDASSRSTITGLSSSLRAFIDRLPIAGGNGQRPPLPAFVEGVSPLLAQEPHIEQGYCKVSQNYAWLMSAAGRAVERMVVARHDGAFSEAATWILQNTPTARWWGVGELDSRKQTLSESVPAWSDLNDALFWKDVDVKRQELLREQGGALTDVWPILRLEHFWRYRPADLNRVKDFVCDRPEQGDRLIALSLAFHICIQADNTEQQLAEVEQFLKFDKNLADLFRDMREARERFLSEEADRGPSEAEREVRKIYEEQVRNRAERITRLQERPSYLARPATLTPGGLTQYQQWLLEEARRAAPDRNRLSIPEWQVLILEFGDAVARAFRDAAVAHWRDHRPDIYSEGRSGNSIPSTVIFGLTGIEIEAAEAPDLFVSLSDAEVRHALRYLSWEINGFPNWAEAAHIRRPAVMIEAVLAEACWELAADPTCTATAHILHDIVYHAPWLHAGLAKPLLGWLRGNNVSNLPSLQHALTIIAYGDVTADTLASLAKEKAMHAASEQRPLWYATWVDTDAEEAIPQLAAWLKSQSSDEDAVRAAQEFLTSLLGNQFSERAGSRVGSFRNAEHLGCLYDLACCYVRREHDIDRPDGEAYSAELRDHAQYARSKLLHLLAEIPGKPTHTALIKLAGQEPEACHSKWLRRLARQRAERDADQVSWAAADLRQFGVDQTRTPTTHRELFDATVQLLHDLKDWLERGNESPYRTWARADDEGEMRNLIVGRLNQEAKARFTCAQENELPNRQRTDIWTQIPAASAVPIELKLLDKGWSGPDLCERLRNQLAGDYLREERGGCGVMLLIRQNKTQSWRIGGGKVDIDGLREALLAHWTEVSPRFPNVEDIEVIIIDLTVRDQRSVQ